MKHILPNFQFAVRTFLAIVFTIVTLFQSAASQVPVSGPKTAQPKAETKFKKFSGNEVFFRSDKVWGFSLNLSGYLNLTHIESTKERVAFGVREDSIGLTMANLFVHDHWADSKDTTASLMMNKIVKAFGIDTSIIPITIEHDSVGIFQTALYDKIEIWPQPDPNRPGQTFDSTFTRRHFQAITIINDSPIEFHFSKTEYRAGDSLMFSELLSTFKFHETIPSKIDSSGGAEILDK